MKMPLKYVIEMFMDRVAASKIYYKENYTDSHAFDYYKKEPKIYYHAPGDAKAFRTSASHAEPARRGLYDGLYSPCGIERKL